MISRSDIPKEAVSENAEKLLIWQGFSPKMAVYRRFSVVANRLPVPSVISRTNRPQVLWGQVRYWALPVLWGQVPHPLVRLCER